MDQIKNIDDTVNDAEIKEVYNNGNEGKGKKDYYTELALFLILGILLGIAIKTEAAKRVTIGYNDYKMKIMSQDFDISKMQKDMLAKQIEAAKQEQENVQEQIPGDNTDGNNDSQNQ